MTGHLIEMSVESVRVHMLSTQHVVILRELLGRDRYLPIWIGQWEASAIALRLQGQTPERPLTHDLFASVLEALGARVREVVISSLADETFHARVMLESAGQMIEIDSRPSDALALAVRTGARILAAEAVLERAGVERHQVAGEAESIDESKLSVFRDFVNSLDREPGADERRGGRPPA